jgi:hypothetical protein
MLVVVAELVAVRAEQLDPIVRERIMRGRDHDSQVGAHRPRQHRHRWSRHRPEQHDVHADAGEAGNHRRFHHVTGQARVLADDDTVAMIASKEVRARRLADPERGLGRHRLEIGGSADAVGAEEFTRHGRALARAGHCRYFTPCMIFLSHGEIARRITPATIVDSPPTMKVCAYVCSASCGFVTSPPTV